MNFTWAYPPFGVFVMPVMFDLPSNVESPIVVAFGFSAIDWIWLCFPKSAESTIVFWPSALMSIIPNF